LFSAWVWPRSGSLTQEAMRQGYYNSYEDTLISGNYRHGILTLIIPFGIFGFLSFLWFCVAALGALYRNYRYGEEPLRLINTFLLAYFCARLVFYITLYGQFDLDLVLFTGTVGLSRFEWQVKTRETPENEEIVKWKNQCQLNDIGQSRVHLSQIPY
jgi:hypothetical protein